ncbi:MAG: glycosyltransferase family 39 protein [Candidatus Coatesbacteria bacterium]|nr:MAG: glycosyltransferase family 39 protein [Candidatus Coatesbacteria bacterium]
MGIRIPPAWYVVLLAAVAGAAATCLVLQLKQPLVADEPQFVDVAFSLAHTARPMAFSGSTWNAVLSHPLLYHSLLAVPVGFAGKLPEAARLVGLLAFFATGAFLWALARKVTGERWGPFLAVLLYGLHPLALQSALLVEIDTTLLPLLTVVGAWYLARRGFDLGGGGWLGLGLLFGVSLAAKFTTPPLLLGALALYYVGARRGRQLAYVAAAGGVGVALFAAYYFPYCLLLELPWREAFAHSFGRATAGAVTGGLLLKRAIRLLLWVGVPFLLTFLLWIFQQARRRLAPVNAAVTYAALASLILLAFYLFVGGDGYGFPKYHAPLVPLVALALGATFGPQLARESKFTVLFLSGTAFIFYLLVARDPLHWPYLAREATEVLGVREGEVRKALALTGAFLTLPVIAFVVMTRRGGRTMSFVILAAAGGAALNVWHLRADYEHRYNYGERGFREAVAALEGGPTDMNYLLPVDVAFATGYRYPHGATEEALAREEGLFEWVEDPRTAAIVLRDSYYLHAPYRAALQHPWALTVLEMKYDLKRYGSFAVAWRKKELYPVRAGGPPPEEEPILLE